MTPASALLDREPGPSEDRCVYLCRRSYREPQLAFQPVPEPKAGKARVHLDVTVDDIDESIEPVNSL